MKPRVAAIFTGGTISMRFDPLAGGPVPALSGAEILGQTPGLERHAEIIPIDFDRLPGPHMTPARMWDLADLTRRTLKDPSIVGAVITHGTDTLEETAYLLDLCLQSDKPTVFVGAMRTCSDLSWDGPANLRSAIRVAASPLARDLGVLVVMNDLVLSAAEATKTHTEATDTFQGRDFGALGWVEPDLVFIERQRRDREHIATPRLEERVELVKLSAGADGRLAEHAVEDGARALVIEGLGRGNVPITALAAMERVAATVPTVVCSRCPRGRVLDTYGYDGSAKQLLRLGMILGGRVPSHKARVKLMLLLGAGMTRDEIARSFSPLCQT